MEWWKATADWQYWESEFRQQAPLEGMRNPKRKDIMQNKLLEIQSIGCIGTSKIACNANRLFGWLCWESNKLAVVCIKNPKNPKYACIKNLRNPKYDCIKESEKSKVCLH
jgi:uncharacterized FlgJ-related protein